MNILFEEKKIKKNFHLFQNYKQTSKKNQGVS